MQIWRMWNQKKRVAKYLSVVPLLGWKHREFRKTTGWRSWRLKIRRALETTIYVAIQTKFFPPRSLCSLWLKWCCQIDETPIRTVGFQLQETTAPINTRLAHVKSMLLSAKSNGDPWGSEVNNESTSLHWKDPACLYLLYKFIQVCAFKTSIGLNNNNTGCKTITNLIKRDF